MSGRRAWLRWVAAGLGVLLALWWAHTHDSPGGLAVPQPGVDSAASGASPAPDARAPAGIDWFRGSVDEAFVTARAQDKPVFLYWGAEWCPPCNQLKSTIFRRPDFVARTRDFVAVYIDGDGEGAQALQDRFHAMGYPTLIVFDPQGREITRIPGGMDLARYMDVLDLALDAVHPVAEILRRVLDEDGEASAGEWTLLASYAWHQDAGRALGERDPATTLHALVARVPTGRVAERASLLADWLEQLAHAPQPPSAAQAAEARAELLGLLQDAAAAASVRSFLGLDVGSVIGALAPEGTEDRERLLAAWEQRLAEARPAAQSAAERLWLLNGEVELAKCRGPLDEATTARVRATVDRELAGATDVYARSAVLNAAIGVLGEAGLAAYAMDLLHVQLEDPHFGYYWMLDLAALAEDGGDTASALDWLARAVQGAEGRASRIQWGSLYVAGLVRMAPQDSARIEAALDGVLDDLESQPEALHGRNVQALDRIRKALAPWAEAEGARGAVLAAARERLHARCALEFAADAAAKAHCEGLI
jgi:thioredoxin-like negative regulator of GroEL